GQVVDGGHRTRHGVGAVGVVVRLEAVVGVGCVLDDGNELHPTLQARVPVDRIVAGAADHDVVSLGRTTPELDAVVLAAVNLNVAQVRLGAATGDADAVELVVEADLE